MKKFTCILLILANLSTATSQNYAPYYYQRKSVFETAPASTGKIIFCGDSITDGGEWSELFGDADILNRGISGDITEGVRNRVDELASKHPSKLFLLIGINDLAAGKSVQTVAENMARMIASLQTKSPQTRIFVQSVLPVNPGFKRFASHTNKTDSILLLNKQLENMSTQRSVRFIDLYKHFHTKEGLLDSTFTNDGLHLTGPGYQLWKTLVFPYVYDLPEKPALLPLPAALEWTAQRFLLPAQLSLHCDKQLLSQLPVLETMLSEKKIRYTRTDLPGKSIHIVYREIAKEYLAEESYRVQVSDTAVHLIAGTAQGMFYAIQTLQQLLRDGVCIPGCNISDKPAFAWRGIMHDVGRNFQQLPLLKQQVAIMAQYKLNRFHLHLTEDIAWRIQSKLYPRLTDATNMQRNAGEYYTTEELKDLIQFCKERWIVLVPELDMPGHSAAFTRATGVDMQSEQGLKICGELIKEFCNNFNLSFIHIGGDEVKITNPDFLPEICALLKKLHKKIVAWDPGGNVPEGTILQMWNGSTIPKKTMPSLDSRHLYVNHHDPIDAVVSVFNHLICDVRNGDSLHLGAISCVWPDRRVSQQEDILRMNPVFPEMLTLAERSWCGGGWKNYASDIDTPGNKRYETFMEFENRLTEQQQLYFTNLPFPYVKQSGIHWKILGPFANQGKTSTAFDPEKNTGDIPAGISGAVSVYGGTVFLRHFWAPLIGSHLAEPKENSTYYAFTSVYSSYEQTVGMWIGFYNISRSNLTATPEGGTWDNRNSRIWLNGKEIEPPLWQKPGRHPKTLEEPLLDEGYEYREPTQAVLHRGWNRILIKAPVASFHGTDWQSPVKWMFSCMPVQKTKGINYELPLSLIFDPMEKIPVN